MEDKLPRVSQTIIEGQIERKRVEERERGKEREKERKEEERERERERGFGLEGVSEW